MRYCNLFTKWWLNYHELFNQSDILEIVNNFKAYYAGTVKFTNSDDVFNFLTIAKTITECEDYKILELSLNY